ncbi:MAG: CRISPR-associated endonuclease Cas1, partial [Tissierellia bacterium]|nr:CRISPR-associated endonuclease Cas1 [Tissierellia bacterium]
YEGIVSKNYYSALGKIMPKDFKFNKRTRRPPRDPFNSMISLGYTILLHEIIGQIESVGLSAYGGFVHGHTRKHPSLASDLIEEFRQIIVDSLVISMVLNGRVSINDFEITADGVFLNKDFLKLFLAELQNKMEIKQNYLSYLDNPVSYRKAIYHQSIKFSKAIENSDPFLYNPLRIR